MHHFILETDRLILRPLTTEDCDAVFEWVGDEEVARYMVYPVYRSKDKVREWLLSLQAPDPEYHFGFERKEDHRLIGSGSIGPDADRDGVWGFGYNLRRDCWGKGYATEAARAMIAFAHEQFGVKRFSSSHVEHNTASGRVMEKCGLRFVGFGEFQKLDGSCKMRSMEYEASLFE